MRTRSNPPSQFELLPATRPRPPKLPVLSTSGDQSPSPLNSLSPELRNNIYELVFQDDICEVPNISVKTPRGFYKAPGLLLACKQTYAEALKIYYSKTAFRFTSYTRLKAYLSKIGSNHGHGDMLMSVTMCVKGTERHWWPGMQTSRPWETQRFSFRKFAASPVVGRAKLKPGTLQLEHQVIGFSWNADRTKAPQFASLQRWTLGKDGNLVVCDRV